MKQTSIFLMVLTALIVSVFVMVIAKSPNIQGQVVGVGESQKVVISARNAQFYPQTVTVKAGQPVELTLDSSVQGCLRDFTIRDFGIHQYLATPNDVLRFTPQERGEHSFACSMGMAFGKLIVE